MVFPHRLFRIICAMMFCAAPVRAQWKSVGELEAFHWYDGQTLVGRCGPAIVSVQLPSEDVVRVRFNPGGSFETDRSWAVVNSPVDTPRVSIADSSDRIILRTRSLQVVLGKKPLRISVLDAAGRLLCADDSVRGMSWAAHEVRVWKRMPPAEEYLGFGEKAGRLFRRGTHVSMWNSDIPGYEPDTDPLYQTIPFFLAFNDGRSYGIFFDNTYRSSFDMGKELDAIYSFGAVNGELNYYIVGGPSPKEVLSRFTELVGHMPLPPRWSLGYQQCRWSYPSEKRVREIAAGFRNRNIPCDVIYLDIDYMEGFRIFTWNNKTFPDPPRMISDLARGGFKIAVIVDPGIKVDSAYAAYRSGLAGDMFVRYPNGNLFTGKVWPGVCAFPDFTSERARAWWGNNFEGLVKAGVRGFWNDMNEPSVFDVPTLTMDLDVVHDDGGFKSTHARSHNVYGMQMIRATREGIQRLAPDERVFVLTRANYAGGQRYAAAWTGDNVASWEHLRMALHMCLNLSVSGQPFVGSDIGGFNGYPSGELFSRWLELGVFTPLMRAHSVIDEKNKEPWEYGEQYTNVNRETISLRYRFIPYIYTVMREASVDGTPAMRPLIFEFPADRRFMTADDAFMFGKDLLVAPVLQARQTTREVKLPQGTWFDYWTDSSFAGGNRITVAAPLNRLPLFVRAGAVIPTQQVVQYTDQEPIDPLTLSFYPPVDSRVDSSQYYEDDGHSMRYTTGEYIVRTMTQERTSKSIHIHISPVNGTYRPPNRTVVIDIHGCAFLPASVTLNGKMLPKNLAGKKGQGWAMDMKSHVMAVNLPDSYERFALEVVSR